MAKPREQTSAEEINDLLAIRCTLGATLFNLDDLAPYVPVGMHHRCVDRPCNVRTGVFQDRYDTPVKMLFDLMSRSRLGIGDSDNLPGC